MELNGKTKRSLPSLVGCCLKDRLDIQKDIAEPHFNGCFQEALKALEFLKSQKLIFFEKTKSGRAIRDYGLTCQGYDLWTAMGGKE